MIRQAIMLSQQEEEQRAVKVKEVEVKEQVTETKGTSLLAPEHIVT